MALVEVTIRSDSGARETAQAELETPNAGARAGRAAGAFGAGLLVAALSAIVPGPHLLLTIPGGVLGGLIGAWVIFNVKAKLAPFQATCPACKESVQLEGGKVSDRMMEPCPACNRPLQLSTPLPQE
ncbi:MAG: hypothetical protein H6741_16490 [Alphaproteobacteria bacterium]|nr:hypothetical protein [Alphaproteobacteria bacterium]MCB9794314.1 hypothetical protein [Alphaproteobacteria bacterium]